MKNQDVLRSYYDLVSQNEELLLSDFDNFMKDRTEKIFKVTNSKPFKILQQPNFINNELLENIKLFSSSFFKLVNKVYELYEVNLEIREMFKLNKLFENLYLINQVYSVNFPIVRIDMFFLESGEYKICEINADGAGGLHKDTIINNYLLNSNVFKSLHKTYDIYTYNIIDNLVIESLNIYANFQKLYSSKKVPTVAVLNFQETNNVEESTMIKEYFEKKGCKAFVLSPNDLTYNDGFVYFKEDQINLVFKEVINERLLNEYKDVRKFMQAVNENKLCMVGNVKSEVLDNKILFSILHNKKFQCFLKQNEIDFINKYFPFSFNLGDENLVLSNDVINNKDKYVLKALNTYHCKGVFIGKLYNNTEWKFIVNDSWNNGFIAQEFIENIPQKYLYIDNNCLSVEEFSVIDGLFFYNEKFSGIFSRASKDLLISGSGNNDRHLGNIFYRDNTEAFYDK